jgi:hypothetical protein
MGTVPARDGPVDKNEDRPGTVPGRYVSKWPPTRCSFVAKKLITDREKALGCGKSCPFLGKRPGRDWGQIVPEPLREQGDSTKDAAGAIPSRPVLRGWRERAKLPEGSTPGHDSAA